MKTTQKQLQKEVDKINKEYERDGSDYRAYLTGDKYEPIKLRPLSEAGFGDELRLYKVVKPI